MRVSGGIWAVISALHLTGRPDTLRALCSGVLLLGATTYKIKQRDFLPLPRPEITALTWQQSEESRGWLMMPQLIHLKLSF